MKKKKFKSKTHPQEQKPANREKKRDKKTKDSKWDTKKKVTQTPKKLKKSIAN